MKVLIIGQGAREHALAWACTRDSAVSEVWVAPGNPGTAAEQGVRNMDLAGDFQAIADFALSRKIDLTLIGPEQPIVDGLGDHLRAAGLRCLAPDAAAARLEGSKIFAKEFMHSKGIPTADYGAFDDAAKAVAWVRKRNIPVAVKADGLAGGKGVVLARNLAEAEQAIYWLHRESTFQGAGKRLVVEELLSGREASFIALSDGHRALALATSEDHKARDDGDSGPNTGGMGAISPSPIIDAPMHRKILSDIVEPVIAGMAQDGTAFVGFLYVGLMITPAGEAKVLEFNCRLGDPEAQVLLYRHGDDFARLCAAAADGRLPDRQPPGPGNHIPPAISVVMAAAGYPESHRSGDVISGLDRVANDIKVFQGGTATDDSGHTVTAGGRVLSVTTSAPNLNQARSKVYAAVGGIRWDGAFWRTDIGAR